MRRVAAFGLILAFAHAGATQARAADLGGGPVFEGIVIDSGTVMPVGDPYYVVDFHLVLAPGYTLVAGDSLTITQLPFGTNITQVEPPDGWAEQITTDPPSYDYTVTYQPKVAGSSIVATAATGPVSLLDLIITTTINTETMSQAMVEADLALLTSTPVVYSSTTTNNSTGQSQTVTNNAITPALSVPAPPALVLIALGLGTTWAGAVGRRVWRRRPTA